MTPSESFGRQHLSNFSKIGQLLGNFWEKWATLGHLFTNFWATFGFFTCNLWKGLLPWQQQNQYIFVQGLDQHVRICPQLTTRSNWGENSFRVTYPLLTELNNLPAFLNLFFIFSEIVRSLRKSFDVFGKKRKISESFQNNLPEIFGSVRKMFGKLRKPSEVFECNRSFMIFFIYLIFQSLTPVDCSKIRFKNFDL